MAKEFARALQQLPEGAEDEGDAPDADSGDEWTGSGSGREQLNDEAFGSSPPRSSRGQQSAHSRSRSGRSRTASPSRLGTGATGSGGGPASRQRSPLTRKGNRGLLDQLEEALAASLDPTVLTGGLTRVQGRGRSGGRRRVRCFALRLVGGAGWAWGA